MARHDLVCCYCNQPYIAKKKPVGDVWFCRDSHRSMYHQGIPYNSDTGILRKPLTQVLTQNTQETPPPDHTILAILQRMDERMEYIMNRLDQGSVEITTTIKQQIAPPPPSDAAVGGDILGKIEISRSQAAPDRWGNYKYGFNLQLSLYAGNPKGWDNLTADAIEYGLETNKFPSNLVKAARDTLDSRYKRAATAQEMETILTQGAAKKIAGSDIELPAEVNYDDFDDLL